MKPGRGGFLRMMAFIPSENRIDVRTYSPLLKEYLEDNDNQFDLPYAMDAGTVSSGKNAP